jgi:hypothetical protein
VRVVRVGHPPGQRGQGAGPCNPRARALYERLGYVAYDRKPEAWDEEAEDGSVRRYETVCTLMRKELP